jgi:hypothetical protein
VNNEFDGVWKEAVMALFKDISSQLRERIAEDCENPSILGGMARIWNRYVPSTGQRHCGFSQLAWYQEKQQNKPKKYSKCGTKQGYVLLILWSAA